MPYFVGLSGREVYLRRYYSLTRYRAVLGSSALCWRHKDKECINCQRATLLIGNERKYGKGNFCAHYSSFTLFHATVIFISQRRHLGLCCCRLSIRFLEKYKMNESFIKFVSRNCDISLFFFVIFLINAMHSAFPWDLIFSDYQINSCNKASPCWNFICISDILYIFIILCGKSLIFHLTKILEYLSIWVYILLIYHLIKCDNEHKLSLYIFIAVPALDLNNCSGVLCTVLSRAFLALLNNISQEGLFRTFFGEFFLLKTLGLLNK